MTLLRALKILLITGWLAASAQTFFVVRHAERTGEPDPPLNEDGQRRAQTLARLLADANVQHFFTSEAVRTHQTAEPTAARTGRKIEVFEAKSVDALVAKAIEVTGPKEATLIVGHRATVPLIVKALGGGDIPPLKADEHDRLLVVTILPDRRAYVVTLRY